MAVWGRERDGQTCRSKGKVRGKEAGTAAAAAGHCLRWWQLQLPHLGCKSFTSPSGQTGSWKAGGSSPHLSCCGRPWSSRCGGELCVAVSAPSHLNPNGMEGCSLQKTFNSWKPNQGLVMPWIQSLGLRAQLLHQGSEEPSLSPHAGLLPGAPALTLAVRSPAQALLSVAFSSVCYERLRNSLQSLVLQLLLVTVNSLPSAKLSFLTLFFLKKHFRSFFQFQLS